MFEYVYSYTDFENRIGKYSKIANRSLSDADIQKELSNIFTKFNNVKSASLDKVNDLR